MKKNPVSRVVEFATVIARAVGGILNSTPSLKCYLNNYRSKMVSLIS